jgi:hypothetical protein
MSTTGTLGGPYLTGQVSEHVHTLVGGNDGNLYAVNGNAHTMPQGGNAILKIRPSDWSIRNTYNAPVGAKITSITSGPDGNIWFTDTGNNAIGEVDLTNSALQEFPLPSGYTLPGVGNVAMAPGPGNTVWFTAGYGGSPAIGEVTIPGTTTSTSTGTTSTTTSTTTNTTGTTTATTTSGGVLPGSPAVAGVAKVSSGGIVPVTVSCAGPAASACSGTVTITDTVTASADIARAKHRRRITVVLGSASYSTHGGSSETVKIKLSRRGQMLLATAPHRLLHVTVIVKATNGTSKSFPLKLIGTSKKH